MEKKEAQSLSEQRATGSGFKQQQQSNKFIAQKKRVFESFLERPKTMLEVEVETGIMRSNICYYIRDWLLEDKIQRVTTGFCSITLMRAGRYSTDKNQWNKVTKGGSNG